MKKIFSLCCCIAFLLSGSAFAQDSNTQDSNTKIKLKVTDAEGNVIEKEYESEEAMENDPALKALGIDVEADGERLSVHSRGEGNQVFIFKGKGEGEPGKIELSFDVEQARIMKDSLLASIRERRERWQDEDHEFRRHRTYRGRADSLRQEERALRDSLRQQRRAAMRASMDEEMAEMKQQLREMREELEKLHQDLGKGQRGTNRALIIQELSKAQASDLEGPEERLELEDLNIFPDPAQGTITIELQTPEEGEVRLKLLDEEGDHVFHDETHSLEDGFLQHTIEVGQPDAGIYTLQIIQNNKALNHRIIIR